jgi:hypothetical protein
MPTRFYTNVLLLLFWQAQLMAALTQLEVSPHTCLRWPCMNLQILGRPHVLHAGPSAASSCS